MKADQNLNLFLGLGVICATIVVISFIVALMGSKAGEIATALAATISGSFVVGAATIAWRSVQQQIASQENIENARRKSEIDGLELGFTSELLVYSSAIIQVVNIWNQLALKEPQEQVITNWPVFIDPLYYRTNIGKIGFIKQQWAVGAIISFYTNLLEINEQAKEFFAGRPAVKATNNSVALRLQRMSANLSEALDGLNEDKKRQIPQEFILNELFMPTGQTLSDCEAVPTDLQDVLLRMAGIISTAPLKESVQK